MAEAGMMRKEAGKREELAKLLTVAGFEFRRNFFSVKMIVAAGFFIFIILASTVGLTQLSGYLFSIEPVHRDYLRGYSVGEELRIAFEENGYSLGNDSWAEAREGGWFIHTEGGDEYWIKNSSAELRIYEVNSGGLNTLIGRAQFELDDPDHVMSTVSPFIANVMALITVVFGFSTVTGELGSKTIDLLATKPMKTRNIIVGKFLGITLALGVPVTFCIPLCSLIIRNTFGTAPSFWGTVGFWFFSVVFIATFVLFSLLFAIRARSAATSVVLGISLFLLFTFFWSLITYTVQYLSGLDVMDVSNPANLRINDTLGLLNPVVNYQNAAAFVYGTKEIHGIPPWLPAAVLVVTAAVLLLTVRSLFKKRIVEQDY